MPLPSPPNEPAPVETPDAARLRAIIDSVAEGLLQIDLQGRVQFINPAASGLLGYAAPELIGQPVRIGIGRR